jgi:hypothetical protein
LPSPYLVRRSSNGSYEVDPEYLVNARREALDEQDQPGQHLLERIPGMFPSEDEELTVPTHQISRNRSSRPAISRFPVYPDMDNVRVSLVIHGPSIAVFATEGGSSLD